MTFLQKLKYLLPSHRRAIEQDMQEELDSFAALSEADGNRSELGSLTLVAENTRAVWMWSWVEEFAADAKYAGRTMKRNPGFFVTAALSLALGIGANTAIFGLMNAIMLKTLPVNDPAALTVLTAYSKDGTSGDFGYGDYLAIRAENRVFSGILAASRPAPISAAIGSESATLQRKVVSSNYFSVLQVRPALGRLLRDGEDEQPVAVLSDQMWRRSFQRSSDVIGSQVDLDGKAFTIVGVAPPEFLSETVGEAVDVWVAMALMPTAARTAPGYTWLNLMGRLKPGFTPRQAELSLAGTYAQLQNRFIERVEVEPGGSGSSGLRNTFSAPLKVLMGVVGIALLMACANLANLLLARAAGRQREIATRLAIGASRMRIFRQLITESVAISLLGGALGLLLAVWGEGVLLNLVSGAGKPISVDLRPDLRVLLFTLVTSVMTGLIFGLAPAIQALRENVGETLKTSGASFGRNGFGLRGTLVAAQVALSTVLLIVGGLFVQTLQNLKHQDLGFRAAHVLSVQLRPEGQHRPVWQGLIPELLQRIEAVPGVESASVSFDGVLGSAGGIKGFTFEGSPAPAGEVQRSAASWVSPGYFKTLRIPLAEGREFSLTDTGNSPPVVIVNRAMARRYSVRDHNVGQRFLFNGKSYEIVGVCGDAKHGDLRKAAKPFVYFAAMQGGPQMHSLDVRTAVSRSAMAADVRRVVRDLDPRLRIVEISALEQLIDQKLGREVLVANLGGFFAGLTLLLVVLGVYGTVAYSIARRTKEIGIRIALGARPANITRVVLRQVAFAIGTGLAVGTAVAMMAGRLLAFLLFGLKPTDLQTLGGAALILCLAALAAAYFPVRRALRLDPTTALRLE